MTSGGGGMNRRGGGGTMPNLFHGTHASSSLSSEICFGGTNRMTAPSIQLVHAPQLRLLAGDDLSIFLDHEGFLF